MYLPLGWRVSQHAIGATGEAIFELNCPEGPVTLRESYGFRKRELRRLMKELNELAELLWGEWETIHDADGC
jgi:hypothetical protein